ncbi:Lipoprotein [Vibrio crassostreae]|uniref:Lipoprotein n=1 Tax=Vibrio crassostreae TaxID=246167 RepID=A0A822N0L9_9VIBR|nr:MULTISPECIES: hypothetical protein [Vibrio]MDH5953184.1 hypothetical protein [Vibrio crassostreae]PTP90075.1 hypothetical protein CWO03_04900 [Vibrio splendidus]RPF18908.1 hypothetical protein EDB12_1907 [Vibrio crassostreae]TCN03056.1 hypothetical protein EDB35_1293 [Vibrio crassostreae]TCU01175.1 hypothetical protein EDB32_1493 [Vibrio crassostreae]
MKTKMALLASAIFVSGCGSMDLRHTVDISEMQTFIEFNVNDELSVSNVQTNKDKIVIVELGGLTVTSNKKELTDTVIELTKQELVKRNAKMSASAKKGLNLSIEKLVCKSPQNSLSVGCDTLLKLRTNAGYEAIYPAFAEDIDANEASSFSLANSVAAMFRDPNVIDYLTKK